MRGPDPLVRLKLVLYLLPLWNFFVHQVGYDVGLAWCLVAFFYHVSSFLLLNFKTQLGSVMDFF
jgi:hypothetical protein